MIYALTKSSTDFTSKDVTNARSSGITKRTAHTENAVVIAWVITYRQNAMKCEKESFNSTNVGIVKMREKQKTGTPHIGRSVRAILIYRKNQKTPYFTATKKNSNGRIV